jgi:hypothetical protein
MRSRLVDTCRELLHSERGIALPVAMLITVIGLGLAAVPIMASINTQSNDRRDQSNDAAFTAADSGAELAVQRQSLMASKLSTSKPCVKKNGTTLEAVAKEATGWCPRVPTTGTETVGNGSYSYRVKPTTGSIAVVVSGTSTTGGRSVNRRLMVNAASTASTPVVFGAEAVVGIESVLMDNGTHVQGNVGSNGNVTLEGGAGIEDCETVRVGTGKELITRNGASASCGVTKGSREYPNVVVPSETSNGRMFTAGGDTYTYSSGAIAGCGAQGWQAQWCPTTKILGLRNDSTVTLGGSPAPYVFCQLQIEGAGVLKIKAGVRVQIIFESPESCGLPSGTTQLLVNNGGKIEAEGASGEEMRAGFYFVGSSSRTTYAKFEGGSSTSNFVLYGPRTNVELTNGASFRGAMVGKTFTMHGGTTVRPESSSFNPDESLPVEATASGGAYTPSSYIECSAAGNETEPSTGC